MRGRCLSLAPSHSPSLPPTQLLFSHPLHPFLLLSTTVSLPLLLYSSTLHTITIFYATPLPTPIHTLDTASALTRYHPAFKRDSDDYPKVKLLDSLSSRAAAQPIDCSLTESATTRHPSHDDHDGESYKFTSTHGEAEVSDIQPTRWMQEGTLDVDALSARVKVSLTSTGMALLPDLAVEPSRLAPQEYWSRSADDGHCLATQVQKLASGLVTDNADLPKALPSVYLIVGCTENRVTSL
ncbi:hypothetical protein BCV69DRAFT_172448 [Microstroma glucosiphilum]|uniref:Uncharacterized protein n=1 Tax=Pseudomicrostroma glucosiphilum TaxID=1684307 RepID=A0A316UAK6_9BASI|nr:hypothetical protein BCV69DRAFT_172448 [Pseudomicrostroma glucosiphilum]PWN21501.1 hypothetical protein BCV69DRAFT_172448 [Pseudomicrostroma glucosiphilum]